MPKVSIILPNFNHEKYLIQRFDTILNQTFQDFELIILDDCSTDGSRNIIETYRNHPKVTKIIYNETNGGTSYKQWIKGVENANADLIWIAESDDWCENKFLESALPHFSDNEVAMVISSTKFVFDNYQFDYQYDFAKTEGKQFIKEKMLGNCGIPNVSMLVFRKENFLINKSGNWNKLKQSGDWLLWINMLNGTKVVTLSDINCYFRLHDTNTTGRNRKEGCDFLEGLDVYNFGRKICNNRYDKLKVYNDWFKSFIGYVGLFNKGVLVKVIRKSISTDFLMFLYVVFSFVKYKFIRQFQKLCKKMNCKNE